MRAGERERRDWRAEGAGLADVGRDTRPGAAGVARLVETRGDGGKVPSGVISGGVVGTGREGFARAADRERVLLEIR